MAVSFFGTKDLVLGFVQSRPGSHLRQIKRELGLAMGVVQYHLYALEKERRIVSRRHGIYKRFYPNLVFSERQQVVLDVLSQESERDLMIRLLQAPGLSQKQLSAYAQLSQGTINWHMKRLIGSGLVKMIREGQFVRYFLNVEKDEFLDLLRGYHPSIWAKWADRFANALDEISYPRSFQESKRKKKRL
jgi:predicted transcriptional regulator